MPSIAAPILNFTGAYIAPGVMGVVLNFGASQTTIDPASITVDMVADAPVLAAEVAYESNVVRPMIGGGALGWERGVLLADGTLVDWQRTLPDHVDHAIPWRRGQAAYVSRIVGFGRSLPQGGDLSLLWSLGAPLGGASTLVFYSTLPIGLRRDAVWQRASALSYAKLLEHTDTLKVHQERMALRWGEGLQRGRGLNVRASTGLPRELDTRLVWERGAQPLPGRYVPPNVQPPNPPVYLPPGVSNVVLNFLCKYTLRTYSGATGVLLNFGRFPCANAAALQILPARYYMTITTVEAELLPSLAAVPLYSGATISQDVGSYAWTLSATGPASLYSQLAPVPGQPKVIRLTINGIAFVFQLDSPRRSQSFGKTVVQITGRSVTAALGTGFARETTRLSTAPFNAQQLAAQALDNTGVTLDWGIEDWLVQAGAWSHSGTPLAAVQAIAEAAGGYVQSHRTLAQLQVRHPYPLLPGGVPGGPWNWNGAFAADVVLSPDAIVSRSVEVRPAAAINAVYLSGADQGVLALVKRAGTAGDLLGAMVVDSLITANAAAAQRGTAVLGAAGDKLMHQLELPVLTGLGQPGVLSTDQLIQVQDAVPWRGRVRAVTVTHATPSVRQSVLVEAA